MLKKNHIERTHPSLMNLLCTAVTPPRASALLVFVVSFFWIWTFSPWLSLYQINPDEGINLGKASLVALGYGPYGEMWNDQGPVFTYLLTALHRISPFNVYAARLLIIAFASLLLASLHVKIRRGNGPVAATIVVMLLASTTYYIKLSSTVLIGLPAVSLAVTALAVANSSTPQSLLRATVAGVIFGLSLQTKFFTFLMAPALLIALVEPGSTVRNRLRLAGVCLATIVVTFTLVMLVSDQSAMANLVDTHIDHELRKSFSMSKSLRKMNSVLRVMPTILFPGLLGLITLPFWRGIGARSLRVPAVWLTTAFVALSQHNPVQRHQILLLVIPLAWFGGIFLAALGPLLARFHPAAKRFTTAIPISLATVAVAYGMIHLPRHARSRPVEHVGRALETYAPFGGWVVADLPLAAFRNQLLVPPELVVYSQKRKVTGNLTDDQLISSIERRRPNQVVFHRFPPPPELAALLADDYVVAARGVKDPSDVHYVARRPQIELQPQELKKRLAVLVGEMTATATEGGGYAAAINSETGDRFGEDDKAMSATATWMRPPGATFEIGTRLLRAHAATGERGYQDAAFKAALTIARSQSDNGGWAPAAESPLNRPREGKTRMVDVESFDEGMQAGAISFLLDVAATLTDTAERQELITASRKGLDFLVATQNSDGAWPQLPGATSDYHALSTLNDNVTTSHIKILLRAKRIFGDSAYTTAARRGLNFLLATQLESGGWAQQYGFDLQPKRARKYEPVAAASIETAYAIKALLEGYGEFEDEPYLTAAERAERWLTNSQTKPEIWSRFYELGTNRPIFGDRDGSVHTELGEISKERREGYDWLGYFPEVADAIRLTRAAQAGAKTYESEKQSILEARWLADLADSLRKNPSSRKHDRGKNKLFQTKEWMMAMDRLLAAIEQANLTSVDTQPMRTN
jgi:hypothetical protein